MRAVLVCNGSINDYNIIKKYITMDDFIISVDGGARHLRNMGIIPNILIGDFDSAISCDLQYFVDMGIEKNKFPEEKDMTDSELAIEKAAEIGADELLFIGAMGSRIDHSLANVFLLKKCMDIGIKACIVDEHNTIFIINSTIKIKKQEGYKLSLIPVSERVTGVTTYGLKYRLDNATMLFSTSWGVSNEFLEDEAAVTIDEGLLLVCVSRD
ncbi:thiamine diphosphokinase [Ruminiclostridium herbifermentans]|uniref:Thiamine diphosphokinase n=1 Tax=Ruminiclostridium herbifermentans TaxID=2488810 RepID=A0A4V6EQ78_9FIRM|nr:thiamine diphosphokinase [Ruminiclostridium herbifermentans]QNU65594.1 thiamine diphosphokinase [Ruminiclostridium herbifermentans]